jgi:hypothetical protein
VPDEIKLAKDASKTPLTGLANALGVIVALLPYPAVCQIALVKSLEYVNKLAGVTQYTLPDLHEFHHHPHQKQNHLHHLMVTRKIFYPPRRQLYYQLDLVRVKHC